MNNNLSNQTLFRRSYFLIWNKRSWSGLLLSINFHNQKYADTNQYPVWFVSHCSNRLCYHVFSVGTLKKTNLVQLQKLYKVVQLRKLSKNISELTNVALLCIVQPVGCAVANEVRCGGLWTSWPGHPGSTLSIHHPSCCWRRRPESALKL